MQRRMAVAGAAAFALIPLGAAVGLYRQETALTIVDAPIASAPAVAQGAVSDHVVVISIDGLRPDAIEKHGAEVLARLARQGATARQASTVEVSKTLPSHMSMLTGVGPDVHGITWNHDSTDVRGTVAVPTVFEEAKRAGFRTAVFFGKRKLKHLLKPGTLDYASGPNGRRGLAARATVEAAARHMQSERPNLVFVHLIDPDRAGHEAGWMSPAYARAVRAADAAVGRLLVAAHGAYGAGGYTVIVTADHGGTGRGHNGKHEEDRHIPWIAWGAGVQQGTIERAVKTTDTAATVLWLLGVERPVAWTGRAVTSAFTAGARYAAVHPRAEPAQRSSSTGRAAARAGRSAEPTGT